MLLHSAPNFIGNRVVHSKTHYLVEAEEAQVTDHVECADSRTSGDLTCHLQANLYDLQRVCKNHLRASSLDKWGDEECVHSHKTKNNVPASHMYTAKGWKESLGTW